MRLEGLLEDVEHVCVQGDMNHNIRDIQHDSRLVESGGLFVCIVGFEQDGHQYIQNALDQGAVALIVTKEVALDNDEVTVIRVKDSRETLARIANKFYNYPTSQFGLIGVTGTNGKTSTVLLIESILRRAHKKTGVIGTIENRIGEDVIQTERTTPDALALQQLFAKMVEANVNDVVMEVSSHALDLKRVLGADFDVAVFTNLTLDHLDYHKTMEAYRDAKLILFNMASKGVINIDDPIGPYFIENSQQNSVLTYSCLNQSADLYAKNIIINIKGSKFTLVYGGVEYKVMIQTPGMFSVYNALAAIGAVVSMGVSIQVATEALANNSVIEGRFEVIESKEGYYAIVDYAHAPDGLENVLRTIKDFVEGKIITVFGCGGDRDKSKRPIMGHIAGTYSDYTIITSDNPRTEVPETIIDEIEVGIVETGSPYEKEVDRITGIRKALDLAQKGDVILVAGKGHENYQIIGKTKIHMDDREIIRAYIQEV